MTEGFLAIEVDDTGDLVLRTSEGGGVDLALIEDVHETNQAVRLRLGTRQGEDPFAPDLGLPVPELIGLFDTTFIEAVIRQCLAAEPRVANVGALVVDFDRTSRIVTVDIPIRLNTGEDISLPLELEA